MKTMKQGLLVFIAGLAVSFAATVGELLNQMSPGLGDGEARIELFRMTRQVMAPPIDNAARQAHETALINGLDMNIPDAVKADVIRELQHVGAGASVTRLGKIIAGDNETLFDPALTALLSIYKTTADPNVPSVIRTAMAAAVGRKLAALIKASGSVNDADPAAQAIFLVNAAQSEWILRGPALRSLAHTGDPASRTVLAEALTTAANSYELSKIITWNLFYAKRLAEKNLKDEGTGVATAVKTYAQNNTLGGCQGSVHAVMCADAAIEEIPDIPVSVKQATHDEPGPGISIEKGFKFNILARGPWELSLTDILGRIVWSRKGSQSEVFQIPKSLVSKGVFAIRLKSGGQTTLQHIVLH